MALRTIRELAAFLACVAAIVAMPVAAAVKAVSIGTFQTPTYVAVAPGAPTLLFVVEQAGRIQVLVNETKRAMPFLDITDLVLSPPDPGAGGEQGLLSVAFAPNYQQSGLFYVFFVNNAGNLEVDEFQRSTSDPLKAGPSTRRLVLTAQHPFATNHNGGQMQFGPGGLLFISTGDGGARTPPGNPARDIGDLLGKILRIDPLHHSGSEHYRIPTDNPFVGKSGRDEIFAWGFRNPWRFSIDNDRIAIGDVGETRQEEVDFLKIDSAKGVNFGWPQYEGNLLFANRPGPGTPKFPMFTYDHTGGRCAIIGGFVVRDRTVPSLMERYLYGDACTGEIRSFGPDVVRQTAVKDQPTGIVLPGLSSFGRGVGGQIYMVQTSGGLSRLEEDPP